MGILDETGFVERLRFFDGQQLFAPDLQAIETFHREMRWLHNQSLHQPGIGQGFAVTARRDDREVRVGPGYALDALGREIVLTRDRVEPVPPVASEPNGESVFFDLAVSYPGDELLEEAETREGICLPRGVVRLREEPVLCWIRLRRGAAGLLTAVDPRLGLEVEQGLRIVLARVEVLQCRLRQDISLAERRSARPARQPHIACGRQTPVWTEVSLGGEIAFHLTTTIDTSAAGFLTTPCYSVRLDGQRVWLNEEGELDRLAVDAAHSIVAPTPGRFQLEVLVTLSRRGNERPWNGWTVVWMGVE
jgi:hypothetical protein